MIYNKHYNQLVVSRVTEIYVQSNILKARSEDNIEELEAGQILIFKKYAERIAFQTLEHIHLWKVKENDLIGYEPGSVILLSTGNTPKVIPTFRFKDCRVPTEIELNQYEDINNL